MKDYTIPVVRSLNNPPDDRNNILTFLNAQWISETPRFVREYYYDIFTVIQQNFEGIGVKTYVSMTCDDEAFYVSIGYFRRIKAQGKTFRFKHLPKTESRKIPGVETNGFTSLAIGGFISQLISQMPLPAQHIGSKFIQTKSMLAEIGSGESWGILYYRLFYL